MANPQLKLEWKFQTKLETAVPANIDGLKKVTCDLFQCDGLPSAFEWRYVSGCEMITIKQDQDINKAVELVKSRGKKNLKLIIAPLSATNETGGVSCSVNSVETPRGTTTSPRKVRKTSGVTDGDLDVTLAPKARTESHTNKQSLLGSAGLLESSDVSNLNSKNLELLSEINEKSSGVLVTPGGCCGGNVVQIKIHPGPSSDQSSSPRADISSIGGSSVRTGQQDDTASVRSSKMDASDKDGKPQYQKPVLPDSALEEWDQKKFNSDIEICSDCDELDIEVEELSEFETKNVFGTSQDNVVDYMRKFEERIMLKTRIESFNNFKKMAKIKNLIAHKKAKFMKQYGDKIDSFCKIFIDKLTVKMENYVCKLIIMQEFNKKKIEEMIENFYIKCSMKGIERDCKHLVEALFKETVHSVMVLKIGEKCENKCCTKIGQCSRLCRKVNQIIYSSYPNANLMKICKVICKEFCHREDKVGKSPKLVEDYSKITKIQNEQCTKECLRVRAIMAGTYPNLPDETAKIVDAVCKELCHKEERECLPVCREAARFLKESFPDNPIEVRRVSRVICKEYCAKLQTVDYKDVPIKIAESAPCCEGKCCLANCRKVCCMLSGTYPNLKDEGLTVCKVLCRLFCTKNRRCLEICTYVGNILKEKRVRNRNKIQKIICQEYCAKLQHILHNQPPIVETKTDSVCKSCAPECVRICGILKGTYPDMTPERVKVASKICLEICRKTLPSYCKRKCVELSNTVTDYLTSEIPQLPLKRVIEVFCNELCLNNQQDKQNNLTQQAYNEAFAKFPQQAMMKKVESMFHKNPQLTLRQHLKFLETISAVVDDTLLRGDGHDVLDCCNVEGGCRTATANNASTTPTTNTTTTSNKQSSCCSTSTAAPANGQWRNKNGRQGAPNVSANAYIPKNQQQMQDLTLSKGHLSKKQQQQPGTSFPAIDRSQLISSQSSNRGGQNSVNSNRQNIARNNGIGLQMAKHPSSGFNPQGGNGAFSSSGNITRLGASVSMNYFNPGDGSLLSHGTASLVTTPGRYSEFSNSQRSIVGALNSSDGGSSGKALDCKIVQIVNVPDGSPFPANYSITKTWKLQNNGASDWPSEVVAFPEKGHHQEFRSWGHIMELKALDRGQTTTLNMNLHTPEATGRYRCNWRLKTLDGIYFGPEFVVDITVVDSITWNQIKNLENLGYSDRIEIYETLKKNYDSYENIATFGADFE